MRDRVTRRAFFDAPEVRRIDRRLAERLWRRYGEDAVPLVEEIRRDPSLAEPVIAGTRSSHCELLHTARAEMVVTLVAAVEGHANVSVGNVVGSNVFNLLVVLGTCASLRPVEVPHGGSGDLLALAALSALLMVVSMSYSRRIVRVEGSGLLVLYLVYMGGRSLLG